jgi:hypothetical protein
LLDFRIGEPGAENAGNHATAVPFNDRQAQLEEFWENPADRIFLSDFCGAFVFCHITMASGNVFAMGEITFLRICG